MVAFAARTLDKPEERPSLWRLLFQGAILLYVGWIVYRTFRDAEQSWLSLIIAAVVLIGIVRQIQGFLKTLKPSPWSMIEVQSESVTLFGRDGSFHHLPLPHSYKLLPGGKVLFVQWGRSAPRRCRTVSFRKKHDLAEADFDELYRVLQQVAPAKKAPSLFAPEEPEEETAKQ